MLASWMEIVAVGDPGGLPQTLQAICAVLIMKNISGSQKTVPPPGVFAGLADIDCIDWSRKNKKARSARLKY